MTIDPVRIVEYLAWYALWIAGILLTVYLLLFVAVPLGGYALSTYRRRRRPEPETTEPGGDGHPAGLETFHWEEAP